ncbi:MAG: 4-hydroxy-3-methylbut-2-en-1-yl diphosphate synthase [Verrucomicrobia bacterium CG_4_10_14_3_um_filter_43_23]|nr:MAG: 1-hydroxy-2-methyl-2-(E)-butenyl 4-diphosphate synthase [Verrucomicrobia bacterium CG1_02_43_26]PIP59277.1 MAG: 4-hydroxy-3-methylbut-2-en-1-yl diphosphate synthase [Verrucomicrobia bacterium CG22_combo_CG10-13_8_21_14_all_43_17]PIX57933.1 MAG: 4-hydroxy-3-methylbut-2-en-1-yl diphosphate synthase [Verrucomicrobia bacterium CG_4_10_14_3_um_filter_43_23]PIY61737.1 MAG: 4-hydroxy-3-methylbut-2-en-1-yl diphosphate synthase [Verrucomicrobia bacterium CG_4_10_14_0_8_um_filter_43_34]PJA43440.1
MKENEYCYSRYAAKRYQTRVVNVGNVPVGGGNPIRIQSMVNTPTLDVAATVKQSIELAEAGCEIIRITAQNVSAAKALKDIHREFRAAGFDNPLVADIHFLPKAAFEALEHVEKVRINPGNFADNKKFAIKEYSDNEYEIELQRLHDEFSPLVKRAKELGKSLRIGTNHGSLSDRIMNRYGDTPLGMVESALEFLRISVDYNYHDIILSMKASNPKVMIQAYRLMVARMAAENMNFPLHLGVTEAGNGEDARVKSAIGIGSLLMDGLGDTIRVSLTENPVYEIPVAQQLAKMAEDLWSLNQEKRALLTGDSIDPYTYTRRDTVVINAATKAPIASSEFPRVFVAIDFSEKTPEKIAQEICRMHNRLPDNKIEGLCFRIENEQSLESVFHLNRILKDTIPYFVLELSVDMDISLLKKHVWDDTTRWFFTQRLADQAAFQKLQAFTSKAKNRILAIDAPIALLPEICTELKTNNTTFANIVFTSSQNEPGYHAMGSYRELAEVLKTESINAPIWIRSTRDNAFGNNGHFRETILQASIHMGSLLCDGIGDIVSIENYNDIERTAILSYNILQGSRLRFTKTEFVSCPSCGRTLFDLETTTDKVREKTEHLIGVTIAIMGCIVNGPGEMADADFGYVGGAPGKINLYVGKECIKYNIPEAEAVDRLVDLIKEHGRWVEPKEIVKEEEPQGVTC